MCGPIRAVLVLHGMEASTMGHDYNDPILVTLFSNLVGVVINAGGLMTT